jgi:hypothetical protein
MVERKRPTGVTIIAILAIIFNGLGLLGGVFALVAGGILATVDVPADVAAEAGLAAGQAGQLGGIAALLGIVVIILSALGLVFGIGALMLQPWAWTLGVGLYALNIIVGLASIAFNPSGAGSQVISLVVAGLVLYYLFTPQVKAAFGRA